MADTTTEAGAPVAEACVDAGGSAIGMPQLCTEWYANQIFWLLVTLAAIYFILSRVALPRIAAVLAERQGTITNDVASAEEMMLRVREAEAAYEKSLADARAEAKTISDETRAKIQAELDKELSAADARIAEKTAESEKAISEIRETAVENVRLVAADVAAEIVALMGDKADAKAIEAAVAERVKG
ncbi:F0F1 ATP synthase subunit B' [Histidinibacterium lentulum]|uniref:ATP synthase subunit b n=1 Tax=Histidinibacterium lentulum TaxID=2480588 RepID=A0A3N2QW46_9RHOB|nr:F0F1 ATP synthase subunit B' [Histidinibacterium lentulum]ROT99377.1 F0F1 ATP synthase subunit B' [Histidinibacterium lentulum]